MSRSIVFPSTPFLLVEGVEEKEDTCFVVESWVESDIEALRDCNFMQNIEFKGHKSSKEEIKKFSREEEK